MKKIEMTIRPENLEEVKQILSDRGVSGMEHQRQSASEDRQLFQEAGYRVKDQGPG